jgi:peptide/nickel transport system substrate-binding protein
VWSDGEPVTSKDVAYTINWAAQNPDVYVQLTIRNFSLAIKGSAGVKGTTNPVPGLQTPDDHTVVLTLEAPDGIYLRNLSRMPYFILPEHLLKDLKAADSSTCDFCKGTPGKTIGSGPYDLKTPITKEGASFSAKHGWWKGTDPNIQEIVYKIQTSDVSIAQLEAGELDFVIRVPPDAGPRLSTVPGLKQLNSRGVGITALDFNNGTTDKALRQAFAYAINRPEIIEKVLGGRATINYTIPPGFKVYPSINKYEFDLDKAKALFAQSKWDKNKEFKLMFLSDEPQEAIVAPVVQQALEAMGLKVDLRGEPDAQFIVDEFDPKKFDALFSFGGSEGVGWFTSREYFACGGSQLGTTLFFLPKEQCHYDELFAKAQSLAPGPEQEKVLEQLALLLNDELPEIYLWQPNYLHVYTDRLGGGFAVYPNERESFDVIETWTLAP